MVYVKILPLTGMEKVYELFKEFKMGNDTVFCNKYCNWNPDVYLSQSDYKCSVHCLGGYFIYYGSKVFNRI